MGVEFGAVGEGLSGELGGIGVAVGRVSEADLPAGDGFDGFSPESAVLSAEADVAVLEFFFHGNVHGDTEAADEVFGLIAVEDDGVDEADGGDAGVEVEADVEGEPLAGGGGGFV